MVKLRFRPGEVRMEKRTYKMGQLIYGVEFDIRFSKRVNSWTYERGKSLVEITPRSAATKDYKDLVLEYMGNC